jgi:leader peptidase (prepilin peptidase)/N-methyltransferase
MSLAAFLDANPSYLFLLLTLLGLVVGSFLNVVILRLPQMMQRQWRRDCQELLELEPAATETETFSLAFPGSHCPQCQAPISAWQNIPVISFVLLRGRCGNCHAAIGWRYPAIELLTAMATVCVGAMTPWGYSLLAYLALTWSLIALAGIDIDHQLLPDDITFPLIWAGLLFNLFFGSVALADAVLGAVAGYLLLWSIYWLFKLATGKEGMGYGDFKLLAALGAWMGWQSLPLIILLSSAVGAVLGIAIIALRRSDRSQPLPFGPYLAAAGWIALLWGQQIMDAYLGPMG